MITLPYLYMVSSRKDKDGRTARSILEAQHFFTSLAVFDPRSAEPLPRPMTSLLDDIDRGVDGQMDGLHDRLWRICDHCGQSFAALFMAPNEEPRRVHELMHVRQVRELDIQSFVKLSMRPGSNIRQKLASDPHLTAPRHVMSFDISENRLLKACARRLVALLEAKSAAFPLSTMEEELSSRIDLWLHSEVASSISAWTNLPPNNTLLSHRDYRRIWDAWGMLDRIDEEVARDWANHEDIAWGTGFWKRLSALHSFGRTQLAEVPLVFDIEHLTIRPFDGVGIPADDRQTRTSDSSPSQGRLILYGDKLPAPKRREVKRSVQHPFTADAVCIDFASPRPWFSTDGKTTSRLRRILAWQRWEEHGGAGAVCTGCFHADGVWQLPNTETIVPLDVFFQDCHEVGLLDTAFRDMTKFLKEECFATDTLVWLVPDFLHDLELGTSRRAINATFPKSEPMPRSIAAVIAQVPYERVRPGDSVMVVDCVGGVRFATKLVASQEARLAEAVPETHGIVWTCHPSVVLHDGRLKRNHASGMHVVNGSGIWTFCPPSDTFVEKEIFDKAEKVLGRCTTRIFATRQDAPLSCGGFRVHALQKKAGDFTIWRYQLPALSMGSVIVDGMYGDFTLVDPSSQSIRPVRGQSVPIPVPQFFNLPKFKAIFPLHQGEGRHSLDYVAEIDFPPQQSSIACRLDLRYTYGADEPYSLDFIPCVGSNSLPHRIHVKWGRLDEKSFVASSSYSSPSFPCLKSWHELRNYPKRDGDGVTDLVEWVQQALVSIDPVVAASEKAAKLKKQQQAFERKIERYNETRTHGTIRPPIRIDKNGRRYFFVATAYGDVFCHESAMRNLDEATFLQEGQEVWFTRGIDTRSGKEKGTDISLDDSLPSWLCKKQVDHKIADQIKVDTIGEFVSANEERLTSNLFYVRFPMLTIMQGCRSLSDPEFPDSLRHVIQRTTEILDECLDGPKVSASFKFEALQVLSYLHAFAPVSFQHWGIDVARNARSLDHDRWRKLAYCIGDLSQPWQQEILDAVVDRLASSSERHIALGVLSIAAWRSHVFLDKLSPESTQRIIQALQCELETVVSKCQKISKEQCRSFVLHAELILAFMRIASHTLKRYAPGLRPGTRQSAIFVDLIDRYTALLDNSKRRLRFHVNVDVAHKPTSLYKTPDLLYAIRCYLTGDDGANAISIVGISEDEGDED